MEIVVLPAETKTYVIPQTSYKSGTSPVVYNNDPLTVSSFTRASRSVTRDRDRFRTVASRGWPPMYAYSSTVREWDGTLRPRNIRQSYTGPSSGWYEQRWSATTGLPSATIPSQVSTMIAGMRADAIASNNGRVKGAQVALGETVVEANKTAKMITQHVRTLGRALFQVKKLQFLAAAKTLGMTKTEQVGVTRDIWRRSKSSVLRDLLKKDELRDISKLDVQRHLTRNKKLKRVLLLTRNQDTILRHSVSAGATLKSAGNYWLAYRYGWMPTYQTIYGEMVRRYEREKARENTNRVFRVSSKIERPAYIAPSSSSSAGNYLSRCSYVVASENRWTVELTQVWYGSLDNPYFSGTQSLGLTNPAAVLWELMPGSFVLDWLFNVGDVLEQMDTWLGKSFLGGCETIFYVNNYTETVSFTPHSGYTVGIKSFQSKGRACVMSRTVLNTAPVLKLMVNPSLTTKRAVDAIALLRNLILK